MYICTCLLYLTSFTLSKQQQLKEFFKLSYNNPNFSLEAIFRLIELNYIVIFKDQKSLQISQLLKTKSTRI